MPLPETARPAPECPVSEWSAAVGQAITQLGTDRFAAALRLMLEQHCRFDSIVVTRFAGAAPPIALYHDLDDVQAAITVQFYATGPYLLDPLYHLIRQGAEPGAYHLADVASEAFFRSQYYRTFYSKIRISDEVGLLVAEGNDSWIVISLARATRRPRFEPAAVASLNRGFAVIAALVARNWASLTDQPAPAADRIDDRLGSFARDRLSPREAEIVQLVLQGHSSRSLAAFLGISEGTVKVHRHNAYSKLGIASQAELFSLATRHLASGQG